MFRFELGLTLSANDLESAQQYTTLQRLYPTTRKLSNTSNHTAAVNIKFANHSSGMTHSQSTGDVTSMFGRAWPDYPIIRKCNLVKTDIELFRKWLSKMGGEWETLKTEQTNKETNELMKRKIFFSCVFFSGTKDLKSKLFKKKKICFASLFVYNYVRFVFFFLILRNLIIFAKTYLCMIWYPTSSFFQ